MKALLLLLAFLLLAIPGSAAGYDAPVKLLRTPHGGIQPEALVDARGTLHLLYLKGDPKACDVFYLRREAGRTDFSGPMRVNSEPRAAIAAGTIRGAQLALGRNGRVHVAWNGNSAPKSERGAPMLYARLNGAGDAFEPQRNLMTSTMHLDGGGSVAADEAGNVFVIWHAASVDSPKGEQHRAVFMAKSTDDGKSFASETKISPPALGVCACCGLKAFADKRGQLSVLYRSADGGMDRNVTLLLSADAGATFTNTVIGTLRSGTCPMSSMSLAQDRGDGLVAMWEKAGQVFRTLITPAPFGLSAASAPDGTAGGRKHPVIAVSGSRAKERTLLAWTEGTGWQKGGALAWELTDHDTGRKTTGRAPGVPVWGRVAAVAEADGSFTLFH